MPPEQALGIIADLDERADVFALGAILTEVLTGKPAYVVGGVALLAQAGLAQLQEGGESVGRQHCTRGGGGDSGMGQVARGRIHGGLRSPSRSRARAPHPGTRQERCPWIAGWHRLLSVCRQD
jgi:hypothetical protein